MRYKRHSLEEKLNAIRMVEEGNSARTVSQMLGLGNHQLYDWLALYRKKGISGLENKKNYQKKRLSLDEKLRIVREYKNSELSLSEFSAEYGLSSSTLSNWICKEADGTIVAFRRKQTMPKVDNKVKMKRLPKEECEKENERLRKENERLRAENLLLKKVKALVEEREAQYRRIGRGPSKN